MIMNKVNSEDKILSNILKFRLDTKKIYIKKVKIFI